MEVIDPFQYEFDALASQLKAQYGLQQFQVFLTKQGDIKLDTLIVSSKDRKKGLGTAVMNALCQFADKHGRRVLLTPGLKDDRWGTTSRARLVRFYKRFGFIENKGRNKDFAMSDGMFRNPVQPKMGLY